MKTVLFLSDTHGYLDEQLLPHFEICDEIWHAGDIGDIEIVEQLRKIKPTRIVWGNIDENAIRFATKENEVFKVEGLLFLMTHIIGTKKSYSKRLKDLLLEFKPNVLLFGHSHEVVVQKDNNGLVLINPGAAGKQGFHLVRTAFKLTIDKEKITNLELIKLGKR